mmetsp:Transcript_56329/g.132745  ORF Transcript_56329/g.132745 Transcript_56329/m.132745 type:complete len:210 (-) Transcript_56329:74-703(-)
MWFFPCPGALWWTTTGAALDVCRTCTPGSDGCTPVTNYTTMYIEEYGGVSGEDDLKSEMFKRGPVACGIDAGPLENWDGKGVIDGSTQGQVDHIISLYGWGVTADGTEYWIGRNSWGTYWGDNGWFRITTDYQPGCSWAVPILERKQPSVTCHDAEGVSDAVGSMACPASMQCCCDKRSLFKRTCENFVCCEKGASCAKDGCSDAIVVA